MSKFSVGRQFYKVKEFVGASKQHTEDAEFNVGYTEFQSITEEMMEIGAVTTVFLEQAKIWTSTSLQMADNFNAYFQNGRDFSANAEKFRKANDDIANVTRKSVAIVVLEQCLNPLRAFCSEKVPEIEKRVQQRETYRIDFDRYTERLASLRGKDDPEKLRITQQKLGEAKENYTQLNKELIAEFKSLKASKEKLLINQATAMFVCQQELFRRSADCLEPVLAGLDSGIRRKTEKSIEQFIRSGGPDQQSTANAMQNNRNSFQIKAALVEGASTVPPTFSSGGPGFGGPNKFSRAVPQPSRQPPPPPGILPQPKVKKTMAIAEYPFEPREDGEVGFAVGDEIEVIEQDDSGWWVGIVKGKKGQFPGNYVKLK